MKLDLTNSSHLPSFLSSSQTTGASRSVPSLCHSLCVNLLSLWISKRIIVSLPSSSSSHPGTFHIHSLPSATVVSIVPYCKYSVVPVCYCHTRFCSFWCSWIFICHLWALTSPVALRGSIAKMFSNGTKPKALLCYLHTVVLVYDASW